ncbi:MAG: hypothetical protein E6R13_06720 [Spirochaetes bacterium]|nr:MAG: hypothetical protein E6R13_06720 [Spirochaetota bacterium]
MSITLYDIFNVITSGLKDKKEFRYGEKKIIGACLEYYNGDYSLLLRVEGLNQNIYMKEDEIDKLLQVNTTKVFN